MWQLDLALADVVSTSTDPRLGAIRLAWWRERLDQLDDGATPAEPRLQAVACELLPRGIDGHALSQLEDAWLPLLEPFPWSAAQSQALMLRGRILFGMGARLLGCDAKDAARAGELWSLVDGARHCSDATSREYLKGEAVAVDLPRREARPLRPLTVLAALAVAELRRPASGAARGLAALRHRVSGGFPRRS